MKRYGRKETEINWINSLTEVKKKMLSNQVICLTDEIRDYKISDLWSKFLLKHNVVRQVDGVYYWNEHVKIDSFLISQFRRYQQEKNRQWAINKRKVVKKIDTPTLFDVKKTRKRVAKVELPAQIAPKNEIGIIRKFIKWVW